MIHKTATAVLAAVLLTGCQTVEHIAKNMEELSSFQLPKDAVLSLQGRLDKAGGSYSLGDLTATRVIDRAGGDFWALFFQSLFESDQDRHHDRSKAVKYVVKDIIASGGVPAYELRAEYAVSFDKDGNDTSSGLSQLSLKRLPDRKAVGLRLVWQLGTERLLEIDLPKKIKVDYYYNDLKKEGGWVDVLRSPTGVTIKDGVRYAAILDCKFGGALYAAETAPELVPSRNLALLVAGIVFDADKVKNELAERERMP